MKSNSPQSNAFADVPGSQMTDVEMKQPPLTDFFHGNPSSSYIRRNILRHVSQRARCVALDAIRMRDFAKLPSSWFPC
jgi:haloalkane dehalogenase